MINIIRNLRNFEMNSAKMYDFYCRSGVLPPVQFRDPTPGLRYVKEYSKQRCVLLKGSLYCIKRKK